MRGWLNDKKLRCRLHYRGRIVSIRQLVDSWQLQTFLDEHFPLRDDGAMDKTNVVHRWRRGLNTKGQRAMIAARRAR